jgi:(S)-2-hydroxy-acid oxidase
MRLLPVSLADYEARAQRAIPHDIWGFVWGGAQDMLTTRRNRQAFEDITLRPRFLRDVAKRDLSTTVLGYKISFPVMLAPAGGHTFVHPDGELASARAASAAGTIMGLSTSSDYSMEEVAAVAAKPLFFQLYHCGEELTTILVRRAEDAGFKAIMLTVDCPLPSLMEINAKDEFPLHRGADLANFKDPAVQKVLPKGLHLPDMWERPRTIPLTFKQLEWLRSLTSLPIILKGIRTAEDARMGVECGAQGILVSNHGGRQIDSTLSSIETLPEVVDAVGGKAEVYLDSGIRRGSDVFKALALGAKGVFIGRPIFWGLALDGENGVRGILETLRKELDLCMGYCGFNRLRDITPDSLVLPPYMKHRIPPYINELRAYALLVKQGAMTQKEFQDKKKTLLGL